MKKIFIIAAATPEVRAVTKSPSAAAWNFITVPTASSYASSAIFRFDPCLKAERTCHGKF
ncbi:hypothetical protein K0H02_19730 [Bacteroides fragilis]|uniref:hypothetical protein n=1 Tax=Bacteroides fragilis TaxID=817 RepID=UPI0012D32C3F|nr:hypothetical protein [Bacteroides fragilis]MCE9336844.1 hypothetical protein [Bacteroides fragilis]